MSGSFLAARRPSKGALAASTASRDAVVDLVHHELGPAPHVAEDALAVDALAPEEPPVRLAEPGHPRPRGVGDAPRDGPGEPLSGEGVVPERTAPRLEPGVLGVELARPRFEDAPHLGDLGPRRAPRRPPSPSPRRRRPKSTPTSIQKPIEEPPRLRAARYRRVRGLESVYT